MTDLEIYRIAWKFDNDGLRNGEMDKLWKQMTEAEKDKFRKYLASFKCGYHGMNR